MKIIVNDYSGIPSIFDFASELALKGYKVFYLTSKQINLSGDFFKTYKKNKNLTIKLIKSKNKIKKDNFLNRRSIEIDYGQQSWQIISKIRPEYCFLISLPIDPLYDLIKKSRKNKIKAIYWVQDIYFLAIKDVINKKIPFVGNLISKIYEKKENYCFKNSFKNILIDKNFNNHFNFKRKDNLYIKNWIPLNTKKFISKKNNFFNLYKNKFKKIYIYAGTLGYKHSIKTFLNLSKIIKKDLIIIISEGKFFNQLKNIVKQDKISNIKTISRFKSFQNFLAKLNRNLIGIVNINKQAADYSVPSKILTYINSGMPIIGFIPKYNQAAKIIKKNQLGIILNDRNTSTINELSNNWLNKTSTNCLIYAKNNFNTKKIVEQIETKVFN
jgi:colanic acid biosynthesis glycosyl transferase WcaI